MSCRFFLLILSSIFRIDLRRHQNMYLLRNENLVLLILSNTDGFPNLFEIPSFSTMLLYIYSQLGLFSNYLCKRRRWFLLLIHCFQTNFTCLPAFQSICIKTTDYTSLNISIFITQNYYLTTKPRGWDFFFLNLWG